VANRIRPIDEKVKSVSITLSQINVEAAAREAGVPPSTLRYDLNKVKQALPAVLVNRTPGPKPRNKPAKATEAVVPDEGPTVCPKCEGKVAKNGTYWVLNWVLMLMMGGLAIARPGLHHPGHQRPNAGPALAAIHQQTWPCDQHLASTGCRTGHPYNHQRFGEQEWHLLSSSYPTFPGQAWWAAPH
jgi:hypothetical protein